MVATCSFYSLVMQTYGLMARASDGPEEEVEVVRQLSVFKAFDPEFIYYLRRSSWALTKRVKVNIGKDPNMGSSPAWSLVWSWAWSLFQQCWVPSGSFWQSSWLPVLWSSWLCSVVQDAAQLPSGGDVWVEGEPFFLGFALFHSCPLGIITSRSNGSTG